VKYQRMIEAGSAEPVDEYFRRRAVHRPLPVFAADSAGGCG
jgi:hypothetical protein